MKCAVRHPNDGSAAFPLAALCCALPFPTAASGTSHPRARLVRAPLVPKVALACPIGRGSPFKVVSSCRRCVLRASQRTLRETGATRAACAAQNRARQFRVKRVCSEVVALGFPPSAGVAPDPLRGTTPRTINRPRGLRLFSRQLGSTRTLQGHPVWGARIVPRVGGL